MGGKTSTTTQGVSIPKEVMDRYNAINTRAENVAGTPFQTYSEDPSKFVAQITPQQSMGISNVNAAAGSYAPYFEKAYGSAAAGMASAQPQALNTEQYMNPFQEQVINATMRQMAQANEQAQSGALGTAVSSGAFGGDRAGIAAANLANQQGLAMGSTLAGLNAQNYNQALQTAQQQQGVNLGATQADLARLMQGGQFYAGLGQAAQQAGLQGAEAQINAGTLGQQTEQAGLSALYNQFQQKQAYPFQVAQFLANIGMGTGALSGSTTTTTQPGSYFSDRRLKEGVERIGEGDNGLPIYKYRYKGEPDTHIGFMADEVERVRPEAVGLHPTGYKTVDYDRATKAEGGVAGPYGSSVGSQPGTGGYVPQAYLPVGDLMMADPSSLDHARQSLAQQLEAVANMSKNVRELDATWDWAQDNWGSDPKKEIVGRGQPAAEWRGGGVAGGYADGGAAYLNAGLRGDQNPVEKRTYLSDILGGQEDAKRRDSLQSPGSIPQARSTGEDIADIAKVAMMFMGMNRGGRTGYATRGGVDDRIEYDALGNPIPVAAAPMVVSPAAPVPPRVMPGADMERLRAMTPGAPTNLLPSGVVPGPDRISRPVTYYPQAPNWKEVTTTSGTEPRTYQYDTNFGMVRDAATGQLISNERSISRNDRDGVDRYEGDARKQAIRDIENQLRLNRTAAQGEVDRRLERLDELQGTNTGSYAQSAQDPRMQFPEEYGAYQDAVRRLDSANATVMPSSVTGRFGNQAGVMMREARPMPDRMTPAFRQRALANEPPLSMYKEYVSPDDMPIPVPGEPAPRPAPTALGLRLMGNEPPASMARMSADDAYIPTPRWALPITPASLSYGLKPATTGASGVPLSYNPAIGSGPKPLSTGLRPMITGGSGVPLSYSPTGVSPAATLSSANAPAAPMPADTIAAPVATGVKTPEAPTQGAINGVAGAGKGYTDVILPDGTVERRTGSRNWRNNNPGNIEYGPFAQRNGAVGSDGRFAVFPTYEAGRAAKEELLFNSEGYAGKTIASAISRYAPSSDGNDTGGYISTVAAAVGADPNTPLSELTAPQRQAMLDAMEKVEGGGAGGDGQFVQYSTAPAGVSGGAAPRAEQSAERAGLLAGIGNDKAYEDRNMLGKMMYDPETGKLSRNALLSLASGVGAMLSSPSQYFLPSLGLGMQGFAGTYAGLEKQAADIKQTEAQALQARMSADASRFIQLTNGQVFVNLGNGQTISLQDYRRNPQAFLTGDPQTDERIRKAAEEAARLYPEAAGGTASAGSQGIMATPQVQSYIGRENQIYDITGQRDMDKATILNAAAAASGARAAIPSLLSQTNAVSQLVSDDAKIRSGALAGMQVEAARMANSLLSAASRITGKDYGQIAADGGVAAAQILQKAAIEAGMSSATGFQELQTILSAVPGVELDADANATLMSSIMVASRRAMEYDRFLREYQVADGNDNQLLSGADQAFQDVYGRRFLQEKEVLKDLIRHGSEMPQEWANIPGAKTPMEYLMDPNLSVEAKNEIVKKMLTPEEISAISDADGRINVAQYFGG